jgi:hypothetical protein
MEVIVNKVLFSPTTGIFWRDYYMDGYGIHTILKSEQEGFPSVYWHSMMHDPQDRREIGNSLILLDESGQMNVKPSLVLDRESKRIATIKMVMPTYAKGDVRPIKDIGLSDQVARFVFWINVKGLGDINGFDVENKEIPEEFKNKLVFTITIPPDHKEDAEMKDGILSDWLCNAFRFQRPKNFPVFWSDRATSAGELYVKY